MRMTHVLLAAWLMAGCSAPPPAQKEAAQTPSPALPPSVQADLLGSDGSWGNTEGPAVDSKGTLYFTSRGTYKGIVSWNERQGFQRYLAVATGAGPGGLWIDDSDNLFVTATNERQILKVTPQKKVSVVAEKFEADPKLAKGPNDLAITRQGTIYFTDPNGYDGSAPNGTVYMTRDAKASHPQGQSPARGLLGDSKTSVFSSEITGPNGIGLSADEKTLYVAHNISADTAKIVRWPLNEDGTGGAMAQVATIKPCVADGVAVDKEGAMWLTCYSFGTAYRVSPEGKILSVITTGQKALTNVKFGRAGAENTLYFTSSDMARVTGYIYRAKVQVPGLR